TCRPCAAGCRSWLRASRSTRASRTGACWADASARQPGTGQAAARRAVVASGPPATRKAGPGAHRVRPLSSSQGRSGSERAQILEFGAGRLALRSEIGAAEDVPLPQQRAEHLLTLGGRVVDARLGEHG